MADQQLDVFDGEEEGERLWEALSSFKKVVRDLVEMTGLSTNVLADTYGFGKGKVATWQNPKREAPNIPPLRFVEVLIKEAQERANLRDGAATVFLAQYGELLKLYCARAKPHNVHRQMLADYQNTLLIRELNNATNAALEQIAALTDELDTLRGDRDEERQHRIALQRQIDSLGSQNQNRAVEKRAALAMRDEVRAALTPYESDPLPVPVKEQQRAEQGGSHENHPGGLVPPLPPPPGRGTKRRGLVLALIPSGVLVVCLAVYIGTQLRGDHSGPKDTAGTSPGPAVTADGSAASRPSGTASAGTSATPPAAGGGPAGGGNSSSGGADGGGSSGNDATGGSGGGSGGNTGGGDTTGGKTGGGSGDAGGSGGSNGSSGSGGGSGATSPKPPAPSGHFQLRNVGHGKCLAVTFGVVFATCADSPATNWTAKAGSDGSYMLYNEFADQCLTVHINQLYMADCGSKTGQNWRTGASSTVVNLYSSMCLDESSGWPVLASCEPSKSTQHWAKE
ncbi:ricin-type beta-trefoil lectin domain protein [Streptomyces sp. NPDC014646]|uniref:RICIN domain-containing protein n=1 Tax=unclassified Streptomyces TaxID=2593676 RepID=UPI0036F5D139